VQNASLLPAPAGDGQLPGPRSPPARLCSKAHQRQQREGEGLQRGQPGRGSSSVTHSIMAASGSEKLPLGFGGFFPFPFPSGQQICHCGQRTKWITFKDCFVSNQNSYFQFSRLNGKTIEYKEILRSKEFITTRTPRSQRALLLLGLILFMKHGKSSNRLSSSAKKCFPWSWRYLQQLLYPSQSQAG